MPQLDLSLRALSASRTVVQETHGLSEFNIVRVNGDGEYVKAQANTAENAEAVGWVQKVHGPDKITVCHMGLISGLAELNPGEAYFLHPDTAGNYTATAPEDEGDVSKVLFIALSETEAIWVNQRGQIL